MTEEQRRQILDLIKELKLHVQMTMGQTYMDVCVRLETKEGEILLEDQDTVYIQERK